MNSTIIKKDKLEHLNSMYSFNQQQLKQYIDMINEVTDDSYLTEKYKKVLLDHIIFHFMKYIGMPINDYINDYITLKEECSILYDAEVLEVIALIKDDNMRDQVTKIYTNHMNTWYHGLIINILMLYFYPFILPDMAESTLNSITYNDIAHAYSSYDSMVSILNVFNNSLVHRLITHAIYKPINTIWTMVRVELWRTTGLLYRQLYRRLYRQLYI